MSDSSNENLKGIPKRLREFLSRAGSRGREILQSERTKGIGSRVRSRLPKKIPKLNFDPRKIEIRGVTEHPEWFRWGLGVLGIFLLAEVTARSIGLFIRPAYIPPPKKASTETAPQALPGADFDSITRRNMFNVEGKIPDPFDQGLLDCFAQARPTTQRVFLLGTIVMNDDRHSVALVQEEGSGTKIAVKKDEPFGDGKFLAMKIDRRKLCFQVRASQELEIVEIPDDGSKLGISASLVGGSEGIVPISENSYAVKRNFLDEKLLNLNDILQTAKAVPYLEQGSGRFMGFLIQSMDPSSPFAQLGVQTGDVLTEVNDISLDNPGKGLEAFQKLRNSPKVSLGIIRGGEKKTLTYDIR